ncbi:DpnII family type II restriction endonuclease [Variovorax sp. J31P179]|uniref:DpnII family type II restriction endonuclease n=1 Tax=Variovorax sp. J31P179 TaxID=3053508 RepID=UPI0025756CCA|nr:DpnII family type II restriction endonuclease [Variovorax sp. J31P179]MDM0083159.1 DpnII family type II restriction endonuclease [Variovorax sp. J31P179]
MRQRNQSLEEVIGNLSPLAVDWMDETAANAIAKLTDLPKKQVYGRPDMADLLAGDFDEGLLCARLFLALSKDTMEAELRSLLGNGGIGKKRYQSEPEAYLAALEELKLPDAMATSINYEPVWSDILVERLRSGRGSAISGQKRGRGLEDFAEAMVKEVFGTRYVTRCTFTGVGNNSAKCDVAVPNRDAPRIVIEVKGYGATGSKMTDIIGDLDAIINAMRRDSWLLFVTDGMTWKSRTADLKKIVERQNDGKIARIYTTKMREEFLSDLHSLKHLID